MKSHVPSGDSTSRVERSASDDDPDGAIRCPIEFRRVPPAADSSAAATCAGVLGELTHCTKWEVLEQLGPYCDEALVVDLSQVKYFDAGGVTTLLTLRERCRSGGRDLVVDRPTSHVRWVLGLVGLDGELLGGPTSDGVASPGDGAPRPGRAPRTTSPQEGRA